MQLHYPKDHQPHTDPSDDVTPDVPGRKDDTEKLRYDLIPPSSLHALATVLTFGAAKYAPRNWEKGILWGRVFGALMRHLWAFWAGENLDPETHCSHLWHAQCCVAFLIEYERTHPELDNRPKND